MKAHLALCPLGVFAYSEEGKQLARELFEKDPEKAAQLFLDGSAVSKLQSKLSKYELFIEEDSANAAGEILRNNLKKLSLEYDFPKNYLHDFNSELTKLKLKQELSKPDNRIIQTIGAIEELEESSNLLAERLREWYSLYFPEMNYTIKDQESFAKLVSKAKSRNDFKDKLSELSKETHGAEFSENDLKNVKSLAQNLTNTYELEESLSKYLKNLMRENFPNLNAVAGEAVGAKLIAIAGDSKRLARMPSSTVQVLGAERALFRHLKTGAKPPKHGAILQHPLLQRAQRKVRGKIARALAGKISIAIKRDVYGGAFMGDELRQDLEKKVERIKKK